MARGRARARARAKADLQCHQDCCCTRPAAGPGQQQHQDQHQACCCTRPAAAPGLLLHQTCCFHKPAPAAAPALLHFPKPAPASGWRRPQPCTSTRHAAATRLEAPQAPPPSRAPPPSLQTPRSSRGAPEERRARLGDASFDMTRKPLHCATDLLMVFAGLLLPLWPWGMPIQNCTRFQRIRTDFGMNCPSVSSEQRLRQALPCASDLLMD